MPPRDWRLRVEDIPEAVGRVDIGIIWHTVRNDLPPLEGPLRRLLERQA